MSTQTNSFNPHIIPVLYPHFTDKETESQKREVICPCIMGESRVRVQMETARCQGLTSQPLSSTYCQAPLSMGFSRKGYWSGLPFPSPGDLPDPGIEPGSPALQADSWYQLNYQGSQVPGRGNVKAGFSNCPQHLPLFRAQGGAQSLNYDLQTGGLYRISSSASSYCLVITKVTVIVSIVVRKESVTECGPGHIRPCPRCGYRALGSLGRPPSRLPPTSSLKLRKWNLETNSPEEGTGGRSVLETVMAIAQGGEQGRGVPYSLDLGVLPHISTLDFPPREGKSKDGARHSQLWKKSIWESENMSQQNRTADFLRKMDMTVRCGNGGTWADTDLPFWGLGHCARLRGKGQAQGCPQTEPLTA